MSGGPKIGTKAPDFTLLEAPGESVSLNEELKRGPVVLAFYPADFSSTCQEELCRLRDALTDFNELGANVLGVSVDGIFSHMAFKKANDIQFPLLSDWEKDVIHKYDVVHPNLAGMKDVAKRSVFVIDTDGTIVYKWVSDDPSKLPPIDEIEEAVRDLQ